MVFPLTLSKCLTQVSCCLLSLGSIAPPPLQQWQGGGTVRGRFTEQIRMIYFAFLASKELLSNANVKFWKEGTICVVKTEQDGFSLPVTVWPAKGFTGPVGESKSSKSCDVYNTSTFSLCKGLYFTAVVSLEIHILCLVHHNHETGLLKAWESLAKIRPSVQHDWILQM